MDNKSHNSLLERILISNTVVIVGGYDNDSIQFEFLSYKAIQNGGEDTANIILDIRGGRKFNTAVIDRCVFNYFIKSVPHPTHGFVPGTNEPNGHCISVIDNNCFGIQFLKKVLEPSSTVYFYNSVEGNKQLSVFLNNA